ncbi:uncharacterized protein TNCV_3115551 [Trichonephila clavipes]|nr:uncharacterized protein TNCV_3115551 [Trichonephila clavipes]
MQKDQEELRNTLEKKIDSVEEKITFKVEEKIAVVNEKIEKKKELKSKLKKELKQFEERIKEQVEERIKEQVKERIKEQVEERIEGVAENFSLISQRMENLEKKLLAGGNENKNKIVPVSAFPEPEFLGEAAEVLQTLPDTRRLDLNSLYNALDLRFDQKYSKDNARLQMKIRLQKNGESLQEYASEVERLTNLAFSHHPATVQEAISLQYFVDGLREGEIQKAVRMADVQDLKSALLYALKLEAINPSEELE